MLIRKRPGDREYYRAMLILGIALGWLLRFSIAAFASDNSRLATSSNADALLTGYVADNPGLRRRERSA